MSTQVSTPAPLPSWKQEVNRRIAAHKNRKGLSVVDEDAGSEAHATADSRAAQAAARVAARYAKAPSYSEMQAAEARAALRAAETATRAALEAQVVAQVALERFETAVVDVGERESEIDARGVQEQSEWQDWQPEAYSAPVVSPELPMEIRWEPDMPQLSAAPPSREAGIARGDWWELAGRPEASNASQAIEPVEAALPIPANLIEFPRQLVATRRMRPRLTGAQTGVGDAHGQLSIFEVDPSTISIDPTAPEAAAESADSSWSVPEWSAIELDAQPLEDIEPRAEAAATAPAMDQAPFGLRLMATAVDAALMLGAVCVISAMVASRLHQPMPIKTGELFAVVALMVSGVLYQTLFLMLAKTTPGMRYAQISLCTFDDESPSREQLRGRLVAMLLSLLPVGLGVMWAVFDDDHMTWHDRLSRTYLRKC